MPGGLVERMGQSREQWDMFTQLTLLCLNQKLAGTNPDSLRPQCPRRVTSTHFMAVQGDFKSNKRADNCEAGSVSSGLRSWVIPFWNRGLEVT